MKSFVHNVIAHPLWWLTEALADAARGLHDVTAPPTDSGACGSQSPIDKLSSPVVGEAENQGASHE